MPYSQWSKDWRIGNAGLSRQPLPKRTLYRARRCINFWIWGEISWALTSWKSGFYSLYFLSEDKISAYVMTTAGWNNRLLSVSLFVSFPYFSFCHLVLNLSKFLNILVAWTSATKEGWSVEDLALKWGTLKFIFVSWRPFYVSRERCGNGEILRGRVPFVPFCP